MPQDAYTLQFVAKQLGERLIGGKISKIAQPQKDALTLLIYTRQGTVKLDIDLSAKFCRASLGERGEVLSPAVAPNFCMLLRKHISNAEIIDVKQQDFERVLYIDLKCFSEFDVCNMRLYLEIMGKYSNAVLVKDGIIVGALKCTSLESAKRVTFAGAAYRLPDKQDKVNPADFAALERLFENKSGDTARFIADNVAGIAYVTAEDICARFGDGITAKKLYDFIFDGKCRPCVDGRDFKAYYCEGAKTFDSILEAQAEYYGRELGKKNFEDKKRRLCGALSSQMKKVEKRLADIYSKLEECKKADEVKLKGELITANIYAVERGKSYFEAVNYYDENGGKIKIDLDARLTPSQNAQRYFKKYAKLKRTAESLSGQKKVAEDRLNYLKSIEGSIRVADDLDDLSGIEEELIALALIPAPPTKKGAKVKREIPFRRYEAYGCKILCGRNGLQNEKLTRFIAGGDLWLHVKGYHSSHVAIVLEGHAADERAIKYAAEICAYYSEAREKDKVAVDYTFKKNLNKPKGAAPGFFEYTNYTTILVAPCAHAEDKKDD